MSVVVKNSNGQLQELGTSATALGVNTPRVGRQLEVAGFILSRTSEDVGSTALGFAAEGPGTGHISLNNNYDPDHPNRNHKRALTFFDGNVGVGTTFSATKPPKERLDVDGNVQVSGDIVVFGDVRLDGRDCAESFASEGDRPLTPGTVVVIADDEQVRECAEPYDRKVAGVFSGAGTYRPGIILGREPAGVSSVNLALVGRVYCNVDAEYSPIAVGDLLTTSATPGHAMKASDPQRAFGAILGKALRPLSEGRGIIPVLIALQ
jgi:hypothetical protein